MYYAIEKQFGQSNLGGLVKFELLRGQLFDMDDKEVWVTFPPTCVIL